MANIIKNRAFSVMTFEIDEMWLKSFQAGLQPIVELLEENDYICFTKARCQSPLASHASTLRDCGRAALYPIWYPSGQAGNLTRTWALPGGFGESFASPQDIAVFDRGQPQLLRSVQIVNADPECQGSPDEEITKLAWGTIVATQNDF